MTNFEKIKELTIDQVVDLMDDMPDAEVYADFCKPGGEECDKNFDCKGCIRAWLESEAV